MVAWWNYDIAWDRRGISRKDSAILINREIRYDIYTTEDLYRAIDYVNRNVWRGRITFILHPWTYDLKNRIRIINNSNEYWIIFRSSTWNPDDVKLNLD